MTWRRVVDRNGLADGDYATLPSRHNRRVNLRPDDDGREMVGRVRREQIETYEEMLKRLAGDIRRMENDARDEQAICDSIANRTGLEKDVVAAVLQEFFNT